MGWVIHLQWAPSLRRQGPFAPSPALPPRPAGYLASALAAARPYLDGSLGGRLDGWTAPLRLEKTGEQFAGSCVAEQRFFGVWGTRQRPDERSGRYYP